MLPLNIMTTEPEAEPSQEKIEAAAPPKIIDFLEAREKLLLGAKETDHQFALRQEILANRDLRKRSVVIRDPIEDVIILFLVATLVVGLLLLAIGGSG